MWIVEPSKKLAVTGSYDIGIVGGGVAGIAAAIAAAREGKHVCLIEREFALGGLATLGLVAIYLPLCDGEGNQMISGISEELLKQSIVYGSGNIPECWMEERLSTDRRKERYKIRFDPTAFAYALDRYLKELHIDILFGTAFSDVCMEEETITHLILENKEGRFAIQIQMVIDASGDADVCFAAKEETKEYCENRKTGWYYSLAKETEYKLNIVNDNLYEPVKAGSSFYGGIRNQDISEFVIASREMAFQHRDQNNSEAIITQLPTIPQLRMTRRLCGAYELDEIEERVYFEDSVGMFGDWRKSGPVFYLPYSTLYGKCKNLLSAGRCISVKTNAWDITRAIPVCALSGEVSGTAASMKLDEQLDGIQSVSAEALREKLRENGNIIDISFSRKGSHDDKQGNC